MSNTSTLRSVLGALLALALVAPFASAQAQAPRVTARLSSGVLRLGDTGALSVTVENARDARIVELPHVDGLVLEKPGRPMTQQYSSVNQGRLYSQTTLTWAIGLRPSAEGDYEIPPITVEVEGQRLTTQPVHLTVVKDLAGEDIGYLEIRPSSTRVVEGQPFTVELVFGWDASREDVNYAELNLPWWGALPGAIELDPPEIPAGQRVTGIVVNGEEQITAEQLAGRERSGRRYHALRVARSFLPTRSGTLEFPTSSFGFGVRARGFSFFDRRPPRGESFFVQAQPFHVEVVALPSEGQPLDYSGAVGDIAVRANADVRDVRVGDSIKFTVEWTGQGNLEFFRVPDPGTLDAFRAFRVYGATEEKSFERRKAVYDLSPLSTEVQEIPALALSVYDPAEERYETIATEPIPIRVRPLEKTSSLEDVERTFESEIEDIDVRPVLGGAPRARGASDGVIGAALVGLPLIGFLVRARVRHLRGDPSAPLERRRRRARRALNRALGSAGDARSDRAAFLAFLAARTRELDEAWEGRDLERWAVRAAPSLPAERRRSTAELLGRLDAAAWGGAERVGHDTLLATAATLEEEGL